ncbi:MAG: carboxypeptidase regulatory-like domain-containing protein [Acidobacteriota bacterium]|nr:carboxypeptidase regulatory-like domain-containing protein [Acidobacteriota bacterium]
MTGKVLRVFFLGVCLAVASAPVRAQSQATTGVIQGAVSDANGAPLPGATVAIRNTATNFEQSLTTDRDGRFRGALLPLGPYRVTVTLQGFRTLVREGLNLDVGQTINLPLRVELSTVTQEVKVTAQAPLVETARTESSVRIDERAVQNLPNNGHNFLDFTKLTPGVTTVQGPDGDELTINGQKGIQNNISVDGADFNNPFFGEQRGGQRPAFTFNLDAVKEVVVVSEGANAEFGRSSSGFVNVVTKSGTNDFHATGHLYYKDHNLSARPENANGSKSPEFASNQYQAGATLGGPIKRDSVFFFLGADYQRGRTTKQTNPNRIEPAVVAAFAALGSPGENLPIQRTNDARVFLGKVDWQASSNTLATGRYNYTWADQLNGTFDVDSWGRSANADELDHSNSGTVTVLSTLSGSLANEFRGQYAREDRPRGYPGPLIQGQSRPLPDTAFDFGSGYRFGEPFFIPVDYHDTRIQLNDNVSFFMGRHSFKAGFEYNRTEAFQTFRGFANGIWKFSSTSGFLNYVNNPNYVECSGGTTSATGTCPAGRTVTGPVIFYLQFAGVGGLTADQAGTQTIRQTEPAVFAQDTWQPIPNLTISLGLRWEAQIEPDPITPSNQVFYAPFIGATRQGQAFPSDGTIPSDKKMWQPRLGISWDPMNDGKMVVRATAGLFYARIPGLVLASSRSTNGSIGQTIYRDSTFRNFNGPLPPTYPNLLPPSQTSGAPDHPSVFVTSRDFQNPRTTAVSLGVDREIVPGIAGLLKYNMSKTVHLTRFVDRNAAELGAPWSTGLGTGGTNGISTLTTIESTASSRYWGWTAGVNKRFENNWGFQAYYTYSKDKSDDDNERDPFSFRYAKIHEDPNDRTAEFSREWGYSDRDQRHRFNAWLLWRAPAAIDLSFRYSYRSAQPLDVTAAGVPTVTPQDRINPDGTVTRRNQGRKDNQYNSFDFRVSKQFQFGSLAVEPGVDVFNVFNSKNLRRPAVTNLVFNFDGTVQQGVGDPRQIQVGVRVEF